MKKNRILALGSLILLAGVALAAGPYLSAANSVSMKVTGFYLSNDDCATFHTVFENSDNEAKDFTQNLDIAGGSAPDGSYNCLALRVDDFLKVQTNSAAQGSCQNWTGTDIFVAANLGAGEIGTDLQGNTIPATTGTDTIYLFFRTSGTGTHVFDKSDGGVLSAPIVVNGTTTLNFRLVAVDNSDNPISIKDLDEDSMNPGSCTFRASNVYFEVTQ